MALPPTYYSWVPASVIEVLGLLLTAWRIYFRLKIHRFWWEDAWAAILLLTGLLSFITYWIYLAADGWSSIIASWIYTICFTCLVTFARMSVLFSIIRIVHGSPRLCAFTYTCFAFFAASWIVLVVEKIWQCASDLSWHKTPSGPKPYCVVQPQISIFEFVTDCIAVFILVALPLRMLWRIKLPKRQRRMILSIFASSVVLAIAAIFHIVGQILNNSYISTAGLHVEVALSIIVCNLLVVVTYSYRFLLHNSTNTTEDTSAGCDDDFTTPPRPESTLDLTTVDLDISLSSSRQQLSAGP